MKKLLLLSCLLLFPFLIYADDFILLHKYPENTEIIISIKTITRLTQFIRDNVKFTEVHMMGQNPLVLESPSYIYKIMKEKLRDGEMVNMPNERKSN